MNGRIAAPEERKQAASARPLPQIAREALRMRGEPLAPATRAAMEPRFGRRFGDVRIHADGAAARAAQAIGAEAFTLGTQIVFGAGRYAPSTDRGERLLTHELTHVAQQEHAVAGASPLLGEAHTPAEAEAERSARDVVRGRSVSPRESTGVVVQRRGLLAEIAGLFSGDDFGDPDLISYLGVLDRTNKIEDYTDSDNKARAVVGHWKRGDSRFILTPQRKILLIRELLSGFTGDDDEQAILDLLRGSGGDEQGRIIAAVGEGALHSNLHGAEQDQLDALLGAHRARTAPTAERRRKERIETHPPELVADLQRRFTSNAESTNRLNCIEIVRNMAPRLFASDPELAERVRKRLAKLKGKTLTMPDLGRAMSELGVSSAYRQIRFDNGNGQEEPSAMAGSAWDAIIGMVGDIPGWHIFGLAVFDGYHSVTVLVDNRPDGPRLYWADQIRIDRDDDFHEEEGSASGFRRYEQAGFDRFISEYTQSRWRTVFTKKGKRYDATLHIWKFRSSLSGDPQP